MFSTLFSTEAWFGIMEFHSVLCDDFGLPCLHVNTPLHYPLHSLRQWQQTSGLWATDIVGSKDNTVFALAHSELFFSLLVVNILIAGDKMQTSRILASLRKLEELETVYKFSHGKQYPRAK